MRPWGYLGMGVALFFLLTPGFAGQTYLEVSPVGTTDRPVLCLPIVPGEAVGLRFWHSLLGGEVLEVYQIGPDRIFLKQAVYESAAQAEFYGRENWVREGGRVVINERGPELESLVIRGGKRGKQRLNWRGRDLPLYELVGDGDAVQLMLGKGDKGCPKKTR